MFLSTLIVSGWNWLWLAITAPVLGLLLLFWSYRAAPHGPARWVCLGLKILGLAALAVCLLEPLWSGQRARPGANLFAIVADNSEGMQIKDRGADRSRGRTMRDLLNPQQHDWQRTLEEDFEVRRYLFDARLQPVQGFGGLTFDGRASAIGSALHTLAERYHGRPLAGILLLTDGNATDLDGPLNLAGLPPVYPVVMGNQDPIRDLSVQQTHTTQTDFEDAPVSIQADVAAAGYRGQAVEARLFDVAGKQVAEQTIRPKKNHDRLAFRFQLQPKKSGLCFYRLMVRAQGEISSSNNTDETQEATLANNRAVLVVDRGREAHRILYVAGRPNWEFKFLNRAVEEDPQLQLVGLIRVAKREPRFHFMGRPGETSNPLYRGFGNQSPEDVQQYDQPVLVRLNTRDKFELRGGFPHTADELYGYQAVILDDVEESFFTPDQAALLQKFVSERGGGFLMLGGMESFEQGKYRRTPVGDMLPVYLNPVNETNAPGPWHWQLTREGWLHPWARMRDTEAAEKTRLADMTPFQVLNRVGDPKPGASVIATVTDNVGKTCPALVVQRFGRGRTAALMVGDMWRWGLHDAAEHHDMDQSWRQLMRWLVTDVPERVELTAQPRSGDPNGAVVLRVRARDKKFQPLDDASVSLEVQPVLAQGTGPATNAIHLQAEPSGTDPGLYEATYIPRLTGGYKAVATVTDADGAEVGRAAAGWSTDMAADEFRSLTPNVALLKTIAQKTGGQIISADRLNRFAQNLPHRQAPVMESWTYPVWHTPAMFGLALACFLTEWGLRRWKGMP